MTATKHETAAPIQEEFFFDAVVYEGIHEQQLSSRDGKWMADTGAVADVPSDSTNDGTKMTDGAIVEDVAFDVSTEKGKVEERVQTAVTDQVEVNDVDIVIVVADDDYEGEEEEEQQGGIVDSEEDLQDTNGNICNGQNQQPQQQGGVMLGKRFVGTWKPRPVDATNHVNDVVDSDLATGFSKAVVDDDDDDRPVKTQPTRNEISLLSQIHELEEIVQQQAAEISLLKTSHELVQNEMMTKSNELAVELDQCRMQFIEQGETIQLVQNAYEEKYQRQYKEVVQLKHHVQERDNVIDRLVLESNEHTNSYKEARKELLCAKELLKCVCDENNTLYDNLNKLQKEWDGTAQQYTVDLEEKIKVLETNLQEIVLQKEYFEHEKLERKIANDKMGKVVVDLVTQFESVQEQVLQYIDAMNGTNDYIRYERNDRTQIQQQQYKQIQDLFFRMSHVEMLLDHYEDDVLAVKRDIKDTKGQLSNSIHGTNSLTLTTATPRKYFYGGGESTMYSFSEHANASTTNNIDPILIATNEGHSKENKNGGIYNSRVLHESIIGYSRPEDIVVLGSENSKLERLARLVTAQMEKKNVNKAPMTNGQTRQVNNRLNEIDLDLDDLMTNGIQMRLRAVENIKAKFKEQSDLVRVTKEGLTDRDAYDSYGNEDGDSHDDDDDDKSFAEDDSYFGGNSQDTTRGIDRRIKQWNLLFDENNKEVSLLADELRSTSEFLSPFGSSIHSSSSYSSENQEQEFEQQLQLWVARAERLELTLQQQAEDVQNAKNQLLNAKVSCNDVRQADIDTIMLRKTELDLLLEQTRTQGSKIDRILIQLKCVTVGNSNVDPAIFNTFGSIKRAIDELDTQICTLLQDVNQIKDTRNGLHTKEEKKIEKNIARIQLVEEKFNIQTYEMTQIFIKHTNLLHSIGSSSNKTESSTTVQDASRSFAVQVRPEGDDISSSGSEKIVIGGMMSYQHHQHWKHHHVALSRNKPVRRQQHKHDDIQIVDQRDECVVGAGHHFFPVEERVDMTICRRDDGNSYDDGCERRE